MSGKDVTPVSGTVVEAMPNAIFRVKIEVGGRVLKCHLGSDMKMHTVKILPGDKVDVEPSQFDSSRGRIVGRGK